MTVEFYIYLEDVQSLHRSQEYSEYRLDIG